MPQFILRTQHKEVSLFFYPEETVLDALNRIGLPPSMVILSLKQKGTICPASISTHFNSISQDAIVYGRIIRNLKLENFLGKAVLQRDDKFVTEWLETRELNDHSTFHAVQQISPSRALKIVRKHTQDFFKEYKHFGRGKIIIGASGGGDSNAMLSALSDCAKKNRVKVITLKGFPDWTDNAARRAKLICMKYGFEQEIIESAEVANYCGFTIPLKEAINSFQQDFGSDELIFLSTFAIQQSLIAKAKQLGVQDIILGANREDILGEAFYYITQKLLPAPFPVRPFGSATFGFPLWKVPKKIIDSVHPRLSYENYLERNPGSTPWRNRFYYLAHLLEDRSLGIDGLLLEGLAKLSHGNQNWLKASQYTSLIIGREAKETTEQNWVHWLKKVNKN